MANNTTLSSTAGITDAQLTIVRTVTITTAILGSTGNFFTIFAILKGKLYHNPSFIFILSLSLCNFIHCIVFHPLLSVQAFHGIWANNMALCNAYSYGIFSNMGAELWGYTCITFNRYFCVVHHHLYSRIYGNARYIAAKILFSWLFYPVVFLFPLLGVWGHFEYAPQKLLCHPFVGRNCDGFCLFVYLVAISSTAPVIIFCYSSIIYKYLETQKRVGLARDRTMHATVTAENQSKPKRDSERQRNMSELRMAFTILAVILVFSSCRMPFMVLYLYDPTMVKVAPIAHTTLIYIGASSNWINPIIYAFTNKQIYTTLRKNASSLNSWIAAKTSWSKTMVVQQNINLQPKLKSEAKLQPESL